MKILLTLFLCLTGLLIFMLVGVIIVYSINGPDAIRLLSNPDPLNSKTIVALKILQISQTIGLFILPGFLAANFFSSQPLDYLRFRTTTFSLIVFTVILMLFAIPAINLLASINSLVPLPVWMDNMEEKAQKLTKAFLQYDSVAGLSINIFMVALLPALGEELIFRGIIQRLFSEWTRKEVLGIIISATLFSCLHLQFQGFLPRFALGVLFGYLFLWSGTLWLPIIAHFTNNLIAIVGFALISKGNLTPKAEDIGNLAGTGFIGLVSLALVVIFLLRIRSERIKD